MSRTSYYYDPPGSLSVVNGPGLVCDVCGKLRVEKAEGSTMVPMPCTPIDEEFGHTDGNIHAHPKCAIRQYKQMKKNIQKLEVVLRKHKLI